MFKINVRFARSIRFARKGDPGGMGATGYGRASPGLVIFYRHSDGKRIGWVYLSLFGAEWLRVDRTGSKLEHLRWSLKDFPNTLRSL